MMATMETDGDGKLSLEEFIAGGGTAAQFKALDTDVSGFVDRVELKAFKKSGQAAYTLQGKAAVHASNKLVIAGTFENESGQKTCGMSGQFEMSWDDQQQKFVGWWASAGICLRSLQHCVPCNIVGALQHQFKCFCADGTHNEWTWTPNNGPYSRVQAVGARH